MGNFGLTLTDRGFKLEYKAGSGGTYAQIAAPAANATSYNNSALTARTIYFYRIRATNCAGDSAYSNEASVTATMPNVTAGRSRTPYDAFGNLTETDAGGVITTLTYDLRGRKTAMADRDMGTGPTPTTRVGRVRAADRREEQRFAQYRESNIDTRATLSAMPTSPFACVAPHLKCRLKRSVFPAMRFNGLRGLLASLSRMLTM